MEKIKGKRYIAIDLLALKNAKLSLEEWTLLENIYFMSNNEFGYCYASKDTLRDIIQVSNGQIYKIIKKLICEQYLIKNKETGYLKTSQKWLNISSGEGIQKMENDSPKNGIRPLQKMETKKDTIKGDNKERKNSKKDLVLNMIEERSSTALNKQALKEWVEYKKYNYKKIGITKIVKMLTSYSHEQQQEIVDTSIMNLYQGLFPPKQGLKAQTKKERTDNFIDNYFAEENNQDNGEFIYEC